MKSVRSSLVALCVAILLAGCGGGNGGGLIGSSSGGGAGGGSGGSGNGSISIAQRTAAMNAIAARFNSIKALMPGDRQTQMVAFLKSRPEFEAAGTNSLSTWARFKDGRLIVLADNRPQGGSPRRIQRARHTSRLVSFGAPRDKSCRIIDSFTKSSPNTATITASLNKAGYSATSTAGTVEDFKSMRNTGVLYISAHGGSGQYRGDPRKTPDHGFGIWTSTKKSDPLEITYDADLDAGKGIPALMYMYAVNVDTNQFEWHYGLTETFARKYKWQFATNSLVYMDLCEGQMSKAQGMRDALKDAGASVYVGWDNDVNGGDALTASQLFFDRTLGANSPSATPVENPPQRAFNYQDVFEYIKSQKAHTSRVQHNSGKFTVANLTITPFDLGFGLLVPSIHRLEVDEQKKELQIYGIFDTIGNVKNPPKVYVLTTPPSPGKPLNGPTLTVISDKASLFTCKLPDMGSGSTPVAGSAGYVVVEIGGRRSNAVPLTAWKGKFTYMITGYGSHKEELVYDLNLRLDVHRYRETAGGPLLSATGRLDGEASRDSKCTFSASGTKTYGPGQFFNNVDLEGKNITWSVNGSPDIPHVYDTSSNKFWQVTADYQDKAHLMELDFKTIIPKSTKWSTVDYAPDLSIGYFPGLEPKIKVNPNTYDLQLGQDKQTFIHDILGNGLTDNAVLKWGTITAHFPPTPDTAG